jgi:hypothetical protein
MENGIWIEERERDEQTFLFILFFSLFFQENKKV